jgi:signal transduction histidine kinase
MSNDAPQLSRYVPPERFRALVPHIKPQQRAALDTINQKVAAAESLEAIISFLFEAAGEVFPCDRISVAFLEDQGRRLVGRSTLARYSPLRLKKGYSEGLAGSSLQQVISGGAPRIIDDLEAYLKAKPQSASTRLLVEEGVRSSLTCPLLVEGRAVGLLFRSSRSTHAYDDYQVMLHTQIAERLSQAVEKAYRIEQLTAANRAYMELLAFASHELKSPLASIIMDGELLTKGYLGELDQRQLKKVQAMVDKANGLLAIARDYLDLARFEGGQFRVNIRSQTALLADVIQPVLDTLEPQLTAAEVTVSLDPALSAVQLACDAELMKIALGNLVGNAVKYGQAGGEIRITAARREDLLAVSVWNRGAGFPKSELSSLFKRFSRLSLPEQKNIKGTGVGLYIVWQIIQLHGGRIWARSEYGQWAEFIFEIPCGEALQKPPLPEPR